MPEIRERTVRVIPATIAPERKQASQGRKLRVAAYCRVSTKEEEQLNSYDVQVRHYTERIQEEPNWTPAGIFADRGITGTSVKNRDEFNRMIAKCKRGKIDMILTKSISRFARNTVDCLKYVRLLKQLNVDVYFEEQGLHSAQEGSEFYITIYGSIAQSESENISANVRWGKERAAKEGKTNFHYKNCLGYRKGADGQPEIVPEEAETIRFIYQRFLAGDSLNIIAKQLMDQGIRSPCGKEVWSSSTVRSILSNEKYKGDVVLNKTYIVDCLTKEVRVNNGERAKYYVSNHHPAIIDSATFGRVQEELARRSSKPKVKLVGTKTEQGRYCSKYALTELLVCGECGTPYRRCIWMVHGEKQPVWRCINRLDYGKKYCRHSPSIHEAPLQAAIMAAIHKTALEDRNALATLKDHIRAGLTEGLETESSAAIQHRLTEIEAEFRQMLEQVSEENGIETFDDELAERLMTEKQRLNQQLEQCAEAKQKRESAASRLDDLFMVLDGIQNHPLTFDNEIVRQVLERVVVLDKHRIKVVLLGGLEVEETIY